MGRTCWSGRWERAAKVVCWPWRKRNSCLDVSQDKLYLRYRKEPAFCGVDQNFGEYRQFIRESFFSSFLQEVSTTAVSSRCVAQRYLSPQHYASEAAGQPAQSVPRAPACALTFHIQVHPVPPSASKPLWSKEAEHHELQSSGMCLQKDCPAIPLPLVIMDIAPFSDHRRGLAGFWMLSTLTFQSKAALD